jgi:hypothetical protein
MNPSLPISDIQLDFADEGSVTPTILLASWEDATQFRGGWRDR